jgi:hypothetical protein
MASASIPAMHGWGNLSYRSLPGAFGLAPRHGASLRAPFLFDCWVAGIVDHTRPRACAFLCFPYPGKRDTPVRPRRFLVRPRLLTRVWRAAAPPEQPTARRRAPLAGAGQASRTNRVINDSVG